MRARVAGSPDRVLVTTPSPQPRAELDSETKVRPTPSSPPSTARLRASQSTAPAT